MRNFISSRQPIIESRFQRALISAAAGFVATVIVSAGLPDVAPSASRDAKDAAAWHAIGACIGAFCAVGLIGFAVLSFGGTKRTDAQP